MDLVHGLYSMITALKWKPKGKNFLNLWGFFFAWYGFAMGFHMFQS